MGTAGWPGLELAAGSLEEWTASVSDSSAVAMWAPLW